MAGQSADPGGDRNQNRPLRSLVPSVRGKAQRYDSTRIWIIRCSGRVQIWKINCWISRPITTTIAPITHGKGERRIRPRHTPSQICARFAGNLTVEAYTRHPWLPEFSKTRASCDIQVTVGKDPE